MHSKFKKLTSSFSLILSLLLLCSCGKSEAVQNADNLIMEIGIVTKSSEQRITTAEIAVSELTDQEQKQLDNLAVLTGAREQYNQLLVNEVVEAIKDIGEVTLISDSAVTTARQAYDALSPSLQPSVSNYNDLTAAEEALFQAKLAMVIKAIDAIGDVTHNSETVITKARNAYNSAEDTVKSAVSNYEKLVAAENELFNIKIDKVIAAIENIGDVTLYSESHITAARKMYNEAPPEIQEKVSNYSNLVAAENTFISLRIENVEKLISEIGTVTLQSENKIEVAQAAYDKLKAQEKNKVKNYTVLKSAKASLDKLKEAEVTKAYKVALETLSTKTDKIEGITWYTPKQRPQYIDERCYVLPYIGQRTSHEWVCIRYNYTGDDWIFFEDITIWVDGQLYNKSFDYSDIHRDNASGDVWENIDVVVEDDDDIDMLWAIANSTETIVRFQGDHYRHDFTITSKDKQAIQNLLIVYEYMISH